MVTRADRAERTHRRFGPLVVVYDQRVLEPRPWTLRQARWAVELHPGLPEGPVLELCSGVGHIGLVVALETRRHLVQVDSDPVACRYAELNGQRAGVANEVRHRAIEAAVRPQERFALIVADPPYVPTAHLGRHQRDPVTAIDGGADGLDGARSCLAVAGRHLAPGGAVLLQAGGTEQVVALGRPARAAGLAVRELRTYGPDRTVALLSAR